MYVWSKEVRMLCQSMVMYPRLRQKVVSSSSKSYGQYAASTPSSTSAEDIVGVVMTVPEATASS